MTGLDPYWMHDGPEGCQAAEARLATAREMLEDTIERMREGRTGGYLHAIGDLEAILAGPLAEVAS